MTETSPVEPVDAAIVILVRNGVPLGSPWQCYMVRRPVKSEFAPDVFVFPGGKVDQQDRDPALAQYIDGHIRPTDQASDGEEWRSTRVAAIRELFEEVNVLLANRSDGGPITYSGPEADKLAEYRQCLHGGRMSISDLVRRANLRLAVDRLHPFSRWITPEPFPRRYDTRFFVAYLPKGQEPMHHAEETSHGEWIAPGTALERYATGDFPLVFATERHLQRMSRYPSIDLMIASTQMSDLEPVTPRIVDRGSERTFLVPGDEGYEDAGS